VLQADCHCFEAAVEDAGLEKAGGTVLTRMPEGPTAAGQPPLYAVRAALATE
jgi:hypothetical protein